MGTNVVGLWGQAVQLVQDATKDAASCADLELFFRVKPVHEKLHSLSPPPKATWKKLVQQKVPLKIATAFNQAAQHSWKLPGTHAALQLLELLLASAAAAGLCKERVAVGSLGSSMQHQLQQSRLLQQLAATMAAMAAEWRCEAAALGGLTSDQLCSDVDRFLRAGAAQSAFLLVGEVYLGFREVWGSPGQSDEANASAWLCDPSKHAEAAMQLCTATLQHASSVLTHVLPVVQKRLPQQAEALLHDQLETVAATLNIGNRVMSALYYYQSQQQQQQQQQQQLPPLLLSPHCLPFVAALLVVYTTWVSRDGSLQAASGRQGPEGRGGVSRNSSSTSGPDSSSNNSRQQHRPVCADDSSSTAAGSSDSGGAGGDALTPCQLELLSLLGLTPQLLANLQHMPSYPMMDKIGRMAVARLSSASCRDIALGVASSGSLELGQQEQRWRFEQRLWLLLPSVLLPCANHLLLSLQPENSLVATVVAMLDHSIKALTTSHALHAWLCLCGGTESHFTPPHPAEAELLAGVLQLADQLLLQQPPAVLQPPTAGAAAAAASGSSQGPSATSSSGRASQEDIARTWASGAAAVVQVLSVLVSNSSAYLVFGSSTDSPLHQASSDDADTAASEAKAAAAAAPCPPPVAKSFVAVCTALEAGMRAFTIAPQHPGCVAFGDHLHSVIMQSLSALDDASGGCQLAQHMGLCGPEQLVLEQRQLYSLLRAVQKLGQQQCWGPQAANDCCWVAALAATTLLQPAPAADECLPSLNILGRCCLTWALQLQQQAPGLLVPGSGTAGQQQGGVPPQHSAAHACIPGWYEGESAAMAELSRLEVVVGTACLWVDGISSPAALAALAAAAGGDLVQLRQQLQALSAAQQAVREGLSDATLTAMVEQMQGTGAMLCRIAVPHFCNNTACGNISGPTDVQLVSRRSCICAGCRTARYCGRGCQRQAWSQHKPVCKALAAAQQQLAGPTAQM